jgi:hypothetical protein
MRINPEDCDVASPSVEDVLEDIQSLPELVLASYFPSDLVILAGTWTSLVQLSTLLGDILARNYRPRKDRMSSTEVETLESKIRGLNWDTSAHPQTYMTKLAEKTLQLYKECVHPFSLYRSLTWLTHSRATLIVLFRPYIQESLPQESSVPAAVAKQKIKLAATSTSSTLDFIIASDFVKYLGPMM